MTGGKFPEDVYEESGCRLPLPKREDLDGAAREIFDMLTDPKGGSLAGLWGPGGIRLHSPRVSECTQGVNRYFRQEAGIAGWLRELTILITARELDNQFEWAAHEPNALKEGLSPETIDIVRHRGDTDGLPETEAVLIRFGRELFGQRRVAPGTFAEALRLYGKRDLVDLVTLMGQYAATATLLTAFDIQLKPGQEPLLPAR